MLGARAQAHARTTAAAAASGAGRSHAAGRRQSRGRLLLLRLPASQEHVMPMPREHSRDVGTTPAPPPPSAASASPLPRRARRLTACPQRVRCCPLCHTARPPASASGRPVPVFWPVCVLVVGNSHGWSILNVKRTNCQLQLFSFSVQGGRGTTFGLFITS